MAAQQVAGLVLVQVLALADLLDSGAGAGSLVIAVVTGRLAITLACTRGVPAARPDGLGAALAGRGLHAPGRRRLGRRRRLRRRSGQASTSSGQTDLRCARA